MYRSAPLRKVLAEWENTGLLPGQPVSLLEAIMMLLAKAWEDLKQSSIINAFRSPGVVSLPEPDVETTNASLNDTMDLTPLGMGNVDLEEYFAIDNDVSHMLSHYYWHAPIT